MFSEDAADDGFGRIEGLEARECVWRLDGGQVLASSLLVRLEQSKIVHLFLLLGGMMHGTML